MKNKKGISLIVLIITIIVVIILAAAVILTLANNNSMSSANEATFKSDVRSFQDEFSMYIANKILNNEDSNVTTEDYPSLDKMKEYISSFSKKYVNKLGIENGELVYYKSDIKTVDNQVTDEEEIWLKDLGIKKKSLSQTDESEFTWGSDDLNNSEYGTITNYKGSSSDVVIPERCTKIGTYTFSQNKNIQNIIITRNVKSLDGSFVYWGCDNLSGFEVVEDNPYFSSKDGVIFNKGKTTLIRYPQGNKQKEYKMFDTVLYIGDYSFDDCNNLESLVLSNNTTIIGTFAICSCDNLKSITIPEKVYNIGTNGGNDSNFNCGNLLYINVEENNPYFSSKDGVLFNKSKTTIIRFPVGRSGGYEIPSTVSYISDTAFERCYNLESITIPNSVTSIGSKAFLQCSALKEVTIPSSVINIWQEAFSHLDLINCRATEKPEGWSRNWQVDSSSIVWGYTGD